MKFSFGPKSQGRLDSVDADLQVIMNAVLNMGVMDITVVEGYRGKTKQDKYFEVGRSKVKWPDGKHNNLPSKAIDIAPWINGTISWNELHCCVLAGMVLACAAGLDIKIRWGGNWDLDSEPVTDQIFQDLLHFELVK